MKATTIPAIPATTRSALRAFVIQTSLTRSVSNVSIGDKPVRADAVLRVPPIID